MSFHFVKTADGSAPTTIKYPTNGATILKGQLVYFDATGWVTNETVGSCYTSTVAGVAEEGCSGTGTAVAVQVNRAAIYRADSTANVAQTDVGINVACDSNLGIIEESTDKVGLQTGVVRIIKYIAASTSQGCEVMINFSPAGSQSA